MITFLLTDIHVPISDPVFKAILPVLTIIHINYMRYNNNCNCEGMTEE